MDARIEIDLEALAADLAERIDVAQVARFIDGEALAELLNLAELVKFIDQRELVVRVESVVAGAVDALRERVATVEARQELLLETLVSAAREIGDLAAHVALTTMSDAEARAKTTAFVESFDEMRRRLREHP